MSNVYPFDSGQNYRIPAPEAPSGVSITVVTDDDDALSFDDASQTTQVDLPDGEVEITLGAPPEKEKSTEFGANLAEELLEDALSVIAERLLMGIEQDIQSRAPWLDNMSNGISLLGLQLKSPAGAAASGSTNQEGTSTVDHPLLLEAMLRFQANARGELLPSDGPVKIRNDGEDDSLSGRLAEALEKDLNHYLTKVAKEYYPDTDRMLLMLGFCGISFKKGSHDPIKRRPVIASIDAKDLIVSNAATDIDGAGRVTHRVMMRPSVLKRMQLVGAYRDIHLPHPGTPSIKNAVDTKIDQVQGIAPPTYSEPDDQDRELYECYCELDIPGFEHELEGKHTGLPLPYKVTLDKEARRILEIRRNWAEDDMFCMPRNRIVAYIFIPGLGFYGIGLLNVLGNSTKAVTAAWRLMIDAGMFANFPGFLYVKSLAKQLTNQFRIPPGGGMAIDTTGGDIRSLVMPLPYKDPSAVFIQLIENIATAAQRVGGTAELQVGEGKQDAPVGTTLAMVEQATKLMSAVHKRLHQAQGQEFDMLKDMLMEDPSALWRHNKKSKVLALLLQEGGQQGVVDQEEATEEKHKALFLAALADCELVPRADPNTSSQTERYLKVVAMRQMATTPGSNLDLNKIDEHALHVMGVDDGDSFFKPPPAPGTQQPSPEEITAQATKTAADARLLDSQTRAKEAETRAQTSAADMASKERIAALNVSRELVIHKDDQVNSNAQAAQQAEADNQQRSADRMHKLALAVHQSRHQSGMAAADRDHQMRQAHVGVAGDIIQGNADRQHQALQAGLDRQHEAMQTGVAQQHEAALGGVVQNHEAALTHVTQQHEATQAGLDRGHEQFQGGIARQHEAEQAELDRKHEAEVKQADIKARAAVAKATPKPKKPAK